MSYPRFLQRLFSNSGAGPKLLGSIIPFGSSAPKAAGTAAVGTLDEVARADHVHPGQNISASDLAGAGLAVENGKLVVKFSDMPASQMRQVVLAMLQNQGGIGVDEYGKMYVDFSLMPDDKINKVLNSLWLPGRLNADKYFYVDGSISQQATGEGLGESASKPFKQIQDCVNYVANNYNIGVHRARILIADGTYNESLTLPAFSNNGGRIQLEPKNGIRANVVINGITMGTNTITCSGGNYNLVNLTVDHRPNLAELANGTTRTTGVFTAVTGGNLYLYGCLGRFAPVGVPISGTYINIGIFASQANIYIEPTTMRTRLENNSTPGVMNPVLRAMHSRLGGLIQGTGTDSDELLAGLDLNMLYDICAYAEGGQITFSTARKHKATVSNEASPTGQRYACVLGGQINTGGGGADFFPGANAGTVEASTYSWYK